MSVLSIAKKAIESKMGGEVGNCLSSIFEEIMKIIKASLNRAIEVKDNNIFVNGQLVEIDADFIKGICDKKMGSYIKGFSKALFIDVTTHCNIKCKYCYYPVDNSTKNRSIDSILFEAIESGFPEVALMGAEPTTRDDLFEIIRRLTENNIVVGMVTNGFRLKSKEYVDGLKDAGLASVCYSMHFVKDIELSKVRLKILKNIFDSGIPLFQLAFTIDSLSDIDDILRVIALIESIGLKPKQVCIRAGARIGACTKDSGLFLSDMIKHLQTRGAKIMRNCGNNLYFCEMRYSKQQLHLARWPDNDTVLPYSMTGPTFNTSKGAFLSPMMQATLSKEVELIDVPEQKLLGAPHVPF